MGHGPGEPLDTLGLHSQAGPRSTLRRVPPPPAPGGARSGPTVSAKSEPKMPGAGTAGAGVGCAVRDGPRAVEAALGRKAAEHRLRGRGHALRRGRETVRTPPGATDQGLLAAAV